MATTSNAGGGTSMGNAQMGTRGLSAGDWVRLQRMRHNRTYLTTIRTNEDTIALPNPRNIHPNASKGTLSLHGYGISKIRRPASSWTEYIASQTADYVLPSQAALHGTSIKNTRTTLCDCVSTTVITKTGRCMKCNLAQKMVLS
jgi:hypothetical protein